MSVAQSRKRSRMSRNLLIGFLALLILYTLAGFLLLPWWLERLVPEQLDQRMGWQAEITDIRTNPFTLRVEALGLSAADTDGEQVIAFDRLMVDMNFFQLVRGIAGFEAIQLDEPYVRVDLLEDYSVNFARDWQAANPESAQEEPAAAQTEENSGPPRLYFEQIALNGGEMLFRDFTKEEMAEFRITPLDLTLNDLATWRREGQDSDYSLLAALGSQTIEWQGDLSVAPFYSNGTLKVSAVGYETLAHFLAPFFPYDLRGGSVTLSSDYEIQAGDAFYLETTNGQLQLDNLAVALDEQSEQARLNNGMLFVDAIGFDLNRREVRIGQVSLDNLDLAMARSATGEIDWLAPLASDDGEAASNGEASSGGEPFRWSVAGITLSGGRVLWQDSQPETAAEIALEQLSVSIGELSHQLEEPVTYKVAGRLASGGQVSLNGQVTPTPFTLEAAISGSDVSLAAFEPYVQEGANLAITNGTLGLDGNLDLDGQQDPLTGTFSGTAEVAGLDLKLPDSSGSLVSWQTLRLAPIEYNVHPARLEIGTVTLAQPVINIVRNTDSVHNVERIARTTGSAEEQAPATGAQGAGDSEPEFIFRIGQLMLENGQLAYTDRTLDPAFTTSFDELNGSVTGLSNISPQQGKVSIRGRVGGVADLDFEGTIGTLGTEDVSDLQLMMQDVSLPALSPYFGRYLGYGVDSGKLNLNLDYEIAGSRIDATNMVVMDRLELGSAIASDQAVNAPVKLGLALLRDSKGVIEVDLPISGDLSDPDFRVGQVVMRAFVNLLAKAAASPFSMLGSIAELAGLSGEELGKVSFIPGSIQLAEGEAEKLAALADALLERPDLLLNIRGNVEPQADGLALLRDDLTAGGKQELSEEAWQEAREAYLAGERSLAPEALSNLASSRGITLRNVLQQTHGVPADQLFLLDPARNAEVGGEGNVVVAFNLDVR
ncbi:MULTISPECIES: DUF748 domain-containing protein [unclassified Marinobacter]|uniref:DUF748 domain-containing protein n=1 Tax=unclassified Marinobacter TaxID=83889 RepID=UPI0019288760|nr:MULTISPECIES: DUF748 domain-containing protein [unclassified Marinobacter]MBL3823744.1 DUF748 domain-containing protein [Marinobacter sp. MC3]MBL3891900.1 DUF748 domain-containing protein [Marinobacter sp. MW3]